MQKIIIIIEKIEKDRNFPALRAKVQRSNLKTIGLDT